MIKNYPILSLLIPLMGVGQITQTICVSAFEPMALELQVAPGKVQSVMAAYLLFYGLSQLLYGPCSDFVGRRPVVLSGLFIFLFGSILALKATSLHWLTVASALQGCGSGVAGVMIRTIPRDLYSGDKLRHMNSILSMGLIVSPLLAPIIGGALTSSYGWRSCYIFLLLFASCVYVAMYYFLPETRPKLGEHYQFKFNYKRLITNDNFINYIIILICSAAGTTLFEACASVLMGSVLGLNSSTISFLFILPLPAALLGSWYAGKKTNSVSILLKHAVICYLAAGFTMWLPAWFKVMNLWTLLLPAGLAFFAAGMLFPIATAAAMQPFALLAGSAGALAGGLQNIGCGAAAWLSSALPQKDQYSLGLLMMLTSLIIFGCWLKVLQKQRAFNANTASEND